MLPVFMEIAVYRNFLFYARCGAKDFFDKLIMQMPPVFITAGGKGKRPSGRTAFFQREWIKM